MSLTWAPKRSSLPQASPSSPPLSTVTYCLMGANIPFRSPRPMPYVTSLWRRTRPKSSHLLQWCVSCHTREEFEIKGEPTHPAFHLRSI